MCVYVMGSSRSRDTIKVQSRGDDGRIDTEDNSLNETECRCTVASASFSSLTCMFFMDYCCRDQGQGHTQQKQGGHRYLENTQDHNNGSYD